MDTITPQMSPADVAESRWRDGLQALANNNWDAACRLFGQAVHDAPNDVLYRVNLANALRKRRDYEKAASVAREAVAMEPDNVVALQVLADCLGRSHDYAQALQVYEKLKALGETDPYVMVGHASCLQTLERHGEAVENLIIAFGRDPKNLVIQSLLSHSFRRLGLQQESVDCIKWVREHEGDLCPATLAFLAFEKRHVFDWSGFDEEVELIRSSLRTLTDASAQSSCSFSLLSLPIEPDLLKRSLQAEAACAALGVTPLSMLTNVKARDKRIRIGFVSYDFRTHPVAQLSVEIFEKIDRAGFEVILYATSSSDESQLRKRLEDASDRFVDLSTVSDKEAARTIQQDGIDILVDMGGFTTGGRMGIFAYRPCAIQISFLGFASTTGAEYIDYLIGDPYVTPLDSFQYYTEKIIQLPLCFFPNGSWRPLPREMSRAEAGLPDNAFVLCAFNHSYKITPQTFDIWCQAMHALPDSVLWLKEINAQLRPNVWREAESRGIARERIVFARGVSYEDHFSRMAKADLFVDTWPYNAHTTASDALWAGLPVVTVYQNSFASRVAASILNAVGLPELAFSEPSEYRDSIIAFGQNRDVLHGYKMYLNENRMNLPLFDSSRYTKELESALRVVIDRARRNLPTEHVLHEEITKHLN